MDHAPAGANYVLGHSEREIRRLVAQAEILDPITERLLRRAGLKPGMRVLDIGCGAGDVSIMAARLLAGEGSASEEAAGWGSAGGGSVVGIDRNAAVLATARARVAAAGLRDVTFREASLEDVDEPRGFDLVIARYVLVHQTDVEGFLRAAARMVRPGGTLAFHEAVLRPGQFSTPPVPDYDRVTNLIITSFRAAATQHDIADRFAERLAQADLPPPELFCETPIACGPDSVLHAWWVETFRSLIPLIRRMGPEDLEAIDVDTLEERLRTAVARANAQVTMLPQVCAWLSP